MARDDERLERAAEEPIVGGLPDVPGIGVAMRLTPGLGVHLRGLADEVLVNDYPGATLQRAERERPSRHGRPRWGSDRAREGGVRPGMTVPAG